VRYAISMPNFVPAEQAAAVDMRRFVDWARMAEAAGWDAFFIWDHMIFWQPDRLYVFDPWVLMAGFAMATERIKIGTMVTPLPRRRPWKVAREAVSLDHLSNGRLILGVGIGAPTEYEFKPFGEPEDVRLLADKLDESLDILGGLWSGEPFRFRGEHYQVDDVCFLPTPRQTPRIPVWVAALWPRKAPLRRAARWDGVFPLKMTEPGTFGAMTPDDVRGVLDYVHQHRTASESEPFDLVIAGWTGNLAAESAHAHVDSYAQAGATWWIEGLDWFGGTEPEAIEKRIHRGPPR
jgi:alkanesulfonate monooxygenase SsuD/methylene tetrahydromethanopterin reductase-like flavin-dependent oxidoreductase (luciferase family)